MTDRDDKPQLPVHITLGLSDCAKIKKEADISSMLLTQTAAADYEQLCQLDVLGIQDRNR